MYIDIKWKSEMEKFKWGFKFKTNILESQNI